VTTEAWLSDGPLGTALAFALIGLLPLGFVALTAFVKISTVLTIARAAIGAHGVPSNIVVLALSVALSFVAMAPVGAAIGERIGPALAAPAENTTEALSHLATAVKEPLTRFLADNTREREKDRFIALAERTRPAADRGEIGRRDWIVLVPAFLVSELLAAFTLGFAIFLPFLIVDLVVANVLAALGLGSMSSTQVSLPFKLLLFVAADGWGLLAESLIAGYGTS
jgi:type III secretion protein R